MYTRHFEDTPPEKAAAVYRALAALVVNLQQMGVLVHGTTVTAAAVDFTPIAALDDNGCILRTNALFTALRNHFGDGTYAHNIVDSAAYALLIATPATDVASCTVALLQVKAALNQHITTKAPHTNHPLVALQVLGVPADAATNITTLNECLLVYQRHFYSAAENVLAQDP